MKMPEGWNRAKYIVGNVTAEGQELSFALDFLKEMAEALEESICIPSEYTHKHCQLLNKFSEWE